MWGQPSSAVRRAKPGWVLLFRCTQAENKASFARWTAEGGCPHIKPPRSLPQSELISRRSPFACSVEPGPDQHQRTRSPDNLE
jgi:hypothetical protein